ncbi:MAG: TetR/AcrR family transcriptional regulator [Pseudomonadota bacterium]
MHAPVKTRDRILQTSLELFNERGERNVTTNHIAQALGMSPGNLYYHFRNKGEIIFELFLQYEGEMAQLLDVPRDRAMTWQDKMGYFEAIFRSLWEYRFLHRDLEQLFAENPALRVRYSEFAGMSMRQARAIYDGMISAGLIVAKPEELDALVLNLWVLATSWSSFLHTTAAHTGDARLLSETMLRYGIYQIICLEEPYVRGEALTHLPEIKARYRPAGAPGPLEMIASALAVSPALAASQPGIASSSQ